MSMIRECIMNEIRMKLVEFDHKGLPPEGKVEDNARDVLLTMAALAVAALEEMDTESLGESV